MPEYPLENIDCLEKALAAVHPARGGMAVVRQPSPPKKNLPLLVQIAIPQGPVTQTWSMAMSVRDPDRRDVPPRGDELGSFPPVAKQPSGVVASVEGHKAAVKYFVDVMLARRVIPNERHWCGSVRDDHGHALHAKLAATANGTIRQMYNELGDVYRNFLDGGQA